MKAEREKLGQHNFWPAQNAGQSLNKQKLFHLEKEEIQIKAKCKAYHIEPINQSLNLNLGMDAVGTEIDFTIGKD